jgi:CheY-like chemotaxis protein
MPNNVLSGRRILLVEDEMCVAMLLEDMLVDLGCEVVGVAHRVAKALAMIAADRSFDMAVLDVNLAGEQSYPVADMLAAHGMPFVFSTGYSQQGISSRYDGVPIVQKPYLRSDVERALSEALAGRAALEHFPDNAVSKGAIEKEPPGRASRTAK